MAYEEEDLHIEGHGSIREEEDDGPKTMQEEMNDILEAFFSVNDSEDDIYQYQKCVESVIKQSVAEGSLDSSDKCPDFELEDQDGEFFYRRPVCVNICICRYVVCDD